MTLFILGCANQDGNDFNAQDGQQQGVIPNNQMSQDENETTPQEEPTIEFPENLSENTPIYFGVHKGFLYLPAEVTEVNPLDRCSFMPPPEWNTVTVIATVSDSDHYVGEECEEGKVTLGNHHEAMLTVHETLRGSPAPDEFTLVYRVDYLVPTLQPGEHILVTYFEDGGRFFGMNMAYIEDEATNFDGEKRILSDTDNLYVALPGTYGELVELFAEAEPVCGWREGVKDSFVRFVRSPDSPCSSTSVSGGNHAPDEDNQPSNSASGG